MFQYELGLGCTASVYSPSNHYHHRRATPPVNAPLRLKPGARMAALNVPSDATHARVSTGPYCAQTTLRVSSATNQAA